MLALQPFPDPPPLSPWQPCHPLPGAAHPISSTLSLLPSAVWLLWPQPPLLPCPLPASAMVSTTTGLDQALQLPRYHGPLGWARTWAW